METILEEAAVVDQLNIWNWVCMEIAGRRLQMLEEAYRLNPGLLRTRALRRLARKGKLGEPSPTEKQ